MEEMEKHGGGLLLMKLEGVML
jgi:hypothetical protein